MHSTMYTAIASALALSLCDSVYADSNSRQFFTRQSSKTVSLQLFKDPTQQGYLTNISIGTPPQPVTVQVDTGSSDLWVYANNVRCTQSKNCIGPFYNPSASSTFNDIAPQLFDDQYGDNSEAAGDYITDTVQLGGVTLNNVTLGLARAANPAGLPLYGILGIGFPDNVGTVQSGPIEYFNLPYWLVEQGIINEPVYSLYLDEMNATTSTLLFGGIDTNKYSGQLSILNVEPQPSPGTSFIVSLTSVGAVDSKGTTSAFDLGSSNAIPVLLDSGTSISLLPQTAVQDIYTQLGVSQNGLISCSAANSNITLAFQFGGKSGPLIGVSMAELVIPATGSQSTCRFGILPNDDEDDLAVLGDTFLRSAYVVYDPGNAQIAIAQAKLDVSSSNIQLLSAVASVPSSIGTLPASLVGQGTGYGTGGIPGSTVGASAQPTANVQTTRARASNPVPTASVMPTASSGLRSGTSIPGIATLAATSVSSAAASSATATSTNAVAVPISISGGTSATATSSVASSGGPTSSSVLSSMSTSAAPSTSNGAVPGSTAANSAGTTGSAGNAGSAAKATASSSATSGAGSIIENAVLSTLLAVICATFTVMVIESRGIA